MNDEFSRNQAPEINEFLEYQTSPDNPAVKEAASSAEYEAYEEYTDNEGKVFNTPQTKSKKSRALSTLSVGVVSSIAAVALGMTSWINVGMKASFNDVTFRDGIVSYEVQVESMTENETLTARLFNGEELLFEQNLTDEDGDGLIVGEIQLDSEKVNNLLSEKAGRQAYRLNLSGVVGLDIERKFDSFVIELTKMESRFDSVTGQCHCGEDGCFHFNLNYTDDMQVFGNFAAKIEDAYGNTSYCEFTDDLHEEQTIFVSDLKGTEGVLTVTYTAEGKPQTVKIDIVM